jgi:hypothetical protein
VIVNPSDVGVDLDSTSPLRSKFENRAARGTFAKPNDLFTHSG